MSSIFQTDVEQTQPSKVSIVVRLIPAVSYLIPAVMAGVSAFLVTRVIWGMRTAEATGLAAVTAGLAEANLPLLVALYLAVLVGIAAIGFAVVRLFVPVSTASAPAWFYIVAGVVGLIPPILVWQAESVMIQRFYPGSGGIGEVASTISLLLTLAMIAAPLCAVLLLVGSVVPLRSDADSSSRSFSLVILIGVEVALITMAVIFHVRTSWLNEVALTGRL